SPLFPYTTLFRSVKQPPTVQYEPSSLYSPNIASPAGTFDCSLLPPCKFCCSSDCAFSCDLIGCSLLSSCVATSSLELSSDLSFLSSDFLSSFFLSVFSDDFVSFLSSDLLSS